MDTPNRTGDGRRRRRDTATAHPTTKNGVARTAGAPESERNRAAAQCAPDGETRRPELPADPMACPACAVLAIRLALRRPGLCIGRALSAAGSVPGRRALTV